MRFDENPFHMSVRKGKQKGFQIWHFYWSFSSDIMAVKGLIGRGVCSLNILRTVRRTVIRFLIELLVRRTWFGQFDELYFVLNWLMMRCKLQPELAADAQKTA